MKLLFGMPLRQTTRFEQCLLRVIELDWTMPDFSNLYRRQRRINLRISYRGGARPLYLLVDSTDIKGERGEEWNARKHGGPKRRLWRKMHIGIDEETLEVRAVEVTGSNIGDAPILPDLIDHISTCEGIGSVTADGPYETCKCHEAIAARGADDVIPPRKNAKPWKPTIPGAVVRNEALRASKYLDRAIWRRSSGCHRRSRI
jgi:hypothetical protein